MKRKYIHFIILNLVKIVHEVKLIHFVIDHNDFVMFYLNFLNLLFDLIENKEKRKDEEEILPCPDCFNRSFNSRCESF